MKKRILVMRAMAVGLIASVASYQCNVGITLASVVSTIRENQEYDLELPEQVALQKEDKAVLNRAKTVAQREGETAQDLIAEIDSEDAYKEAVSEVLSMYYSESSLSAEVEEFTEGLRPCAKEVVKNYEDAYNERNKEEELSYNASRVIVQFEKNVSDESIDEAMDTLSDGGELLAIDEIDEDLPQYKQDRIKQAIGTQEYKTAVIELGLDQSTSRAMDQYGDLKGVHTVERDEILQVDTPSPSFYPNDEYFNQQWSLSQTDMMTAWGWLRKYKNYSTQVWTAVIDTGVKIDHPDLKRQILKKYSVDMTQDDMPLLADVSQPYASAHGTRVAGILAAEADNGIGIAGVAGIRDSEDDQIMSCRLMAIKASEDGVHLTVSGILRGINFAVLHGAEVINISAGSVISSAVGSSIYQSAIDDAYKAGVTVVASAGNDGTNETHYPSDCDHVISVIATDSDERRCSFSNYGSNTDICAPGIGMRSTTTEKDYAYVQGTSYAAPFVAGVAALLKEADYRLTPDEIESIIRETAYDLGERGWDEDTAYGLVNPSGAVRRAISRYK